MTSIQYDHVADLYDFYVPYEIDIPFFIEEATAVSGNVIELMAGTGRVSIPLVQADVSLTCVDASEKMLAALNQKLQNAKLSATILQADVRNFTIENSFELAILPFHSFSELITSDDQLAALNSIYNCLTKGGHFICTLHNPALRLKSADGCLRLNGHFQYENGTLCISGFENYDKRKHVVNRMQFYELYDDQGILRSKRFLEMQFCPIEKLEFETLANKVGFKTVAFYGDYSRSEFKADSSPYMIWVLEK
ncbi:MAG TPA: hypothetical protein DCL61_11075 [Cyanobacteria bacterium UBA12227]|nr:hypothetical protein [Cyanobacteria bacterium UBA12227]HAX89584.1 hypothetical protein [Cyanobacteria bacterium UBA11370]HBY76259.1 hypothetical protein [Cyanobacteria bacterium UBA11148]